MKTSRVRIANFLADLIALVALVAWVVALVLEFREHAKSARRYIQSIWLTTDGSQPCFTSSL